MRTRISRVSLLVFCVLLVLSGFLMSVQGDYWPWYAIMAGFALVLANGRRIESSWRFADADLLRLIRAAEA